MTHDQNDVVEFPKPLLAFVSKAKETKNIQYTAENWFLIYLKLGQLFTNHKSFDMASENNHGIIK